MAGIIFAGIAVMGLPPWCCGSYYYYKDSPYCIDKERIILKLCLAIKTGSLYGMIFTKGQWFFESFGSFCSANLVLAGVALIAASRHGFDKVKMDWLWLKKMVLK